jgi:hypothetical protein
VKRKLLTLTLLFTMLVIFAVLLTSAIAYADPQLIKCPDNTHVWNEIQCNRGNNGPFGVPGGGEGGTGGLIGQIVRAIGGLLGL